MPSLDRLKIMWHDYRIELIAVATAAFALGAVLL